MNPSVSNTTSAADGLYTYGLAGIDMQRAMERRFDRRSVGSTSTSLTGMVPRMRQSIGDAMIRYGTALSGRTTPTIPPKTELA